MKVVNVHQAKTSRLLLDTHTLLWWSTDAKELSRKARRLIQDEDTDVYVSATSTWEVAAKVRLGTLARRDQDPPEFR